MNERLFTVGHSNRTLDALVALLRSQQIATLIDVRAVPRSERHPQFSSDMLRAALESADIVYHWAGRQLGGRRLSRPDSPHHALAETGLRGFADYMDGEEFKRGVLQLRRLATRAPAAMMCAERLPENCHRSLIADYLVLQGVQVLHLLDPGDVREHQLRPEARRESGRLVYDRQMTAKLL